MHNAAMAVLGLPHRYFAFHVGAEDLADALRGARALGLGGLNLTVPHKVQAASVVDRLAGSAKRLGAVNTVLFDGAALVGHNTDGFGFVAGLRELDPTPVERAVVLGTGGASLAIVDGLREAFPGISITWVSRDGRRGGQLLGGVALAADYGSLDRALDGADLLVNATTVGMRGGPSDFPSPVPVERLRPRARVVDVVYPRVRDGLIDRAEAAGHLVQDGLPMLLWQGVRALELWLGLERPPGLPSRVVQAMRDALDPQAP